MLFHYLYLLKIVMIMLWFWSLFGIHTFNNNKLNTMNLSLIFFLRQMSSVANKKTNIVSKINDFNKKNFNNVSYINNSIRHMSSCLGNNKNRFSKTLSNSSCFRELFTSAVLYRTPDSYDNIDNLVKQIWDSNISKNTIIDLRQETLLDLDLLTHLKKNGDNSTTTDKRWSNAVTVYINILDREYRIENGK